MSQRDAKEEGECVNGANKCGLFPFKMCLTTDSMRWDSLKIDPSIEFGEKILRELPAAAFEALQKWQPIEILLHDVDTDENYNVKLLKKESFWFEPLPDIGQKPQKAAADVAKIEKSGGEVKGFSYCLQPFRQVIKKRSLSYEQVIGLVWSRSATVNKIDFSVLHVPRFRSIVSFKRQV